MIKIRDICNLSIEEKRANKIIGSSLETVLKIKLNSKNYEIVKDVDLAELCITSEATVEKIEEDKIIVETEKASGEECPVCWKISSKPCVRHS